jgi:hypothetical protein
MSKKIQKYLSIVLFNLITFMPPFGFIKAEAKKSNLDSPENKIKNKKCSVIEKLRSRSVLTAGFTVCGLFMVYNFFCKDKKNKKPPVSLVVLPQPQNNDFDNHIKFLCGEVVAWNNERPYDSLNEFIIDSDSNLESKHNYVQLVFPNVRAGVANTDLLINVNWNKLPKEILEKMKENAKPCALRMIKFWKFDYTGGEFIAHPEKQDFENHNNLRVTRVLKWLWIMGQFELFEKFRQALKKYYPNHKSWNYWKNAARGEKSFFEVPEKYKMYCKGK